MKPQNVDERLIALVINASGAREVFAKLKTSDQIEDFDVRKMFDAALTIYQRGGRRARQINADVLVEELKTREEFDSIDQDKLNRCLHGAVDRRNDLEQTVSTIAGRENERALKKALERLKSASGKEAIDLAAQVTALERRKTNVATSKLISLEDWTDDLNKLWEPPDCVPTGFPIWDERLGGGFIKGNYHLIVGATGTGKSILTLTLFMNMIRRGVNAIYFNYEIPFEYFKQIMLSQITGVNPSLNKNRNNDELKEIAEQQFVTEITRLFEAGKLNVSDPAHGASSMWEDAEAMLTDLIHTTNADIIFFDTINSVNAKTSSANAARWNEYETIAMASERLTMEHKIAMVFTAQPKQEAITREDKTPQLYDCAGGKVITEKSASCTHLHRTDLLDPSRQIDFSELHITKNRIFGSEFGNTPIKVKYNVDYKQLYELGASEQVRYVEDIESAPEGSVRPSIPPLPGFDIEESTDSE